MSTLYRKYRPQNFTDVVGQEVIVKTLQNALAQDIPAHSYLFTGPRGTGKTSLARIFAKALNCQKRKGSVACGQCAHCQAIEENQSLDIIEIDAASYTGVDNIRSLRETMNNAPILGRYKIYIIDEVHMLSIGAFNALLKIMEEPPSHVIFLLATTELHKVPKTILSRCQRFDLRKFTLSEIVGKLERICKAEKIKIEPAALTLIAKNSGGALRDAESLLTQIATLANGTIDTELVQSTLGVSDGSALYEVLKNYAQSDVDALLLNLKKLEESGKSAHPLGRDLLDILRGVLLYKAHKRFDIDPLSLLTDNEQTNTAFLAEQLSYRSLTALLEALEEALVKIKGSAFGFLPLEIAFVQNLPEVARSTPHRPEPPVTPPTASPKAENTPPSDETTPAEKLPPQESKEAPAATEEVIAAPLKADLPDPVLSTGTTPISLEVVEREWRAIINKVKLLNASLSVALQSAQLVSIQNNTLLIAIKYKFHQERLNEAPNRLTLQEAFDTILGTRLAFSIVSETKTEDLKPKEANNPLIDHALELLGGSVL